MFLQRITAKIANFPLKLVDQLKIIKISQNYFLNKFYKM